MVPKETFVCGWVHMFKCAIVEDNGQDFQCPRSEQLTLQVANQPLAPRQVLIIARFNTCSRLETLQFWKRWLHLPRLKLRLWAAGFMKVTENSKRQDEKLQDFWKQVWIRNLTNPLRWWGDCPQWQGSCLQKFWPQTLNSPRLKAIVGPHGDDSQWH